MRLARGKKKARYIAFTRKRSNYFGPTKCMEEQCNLMRTKQDRLAPRNNPFASHSSAWNEIAQELLLIARWHQVSGFHPLAAAAAASASSDCK